MTTDYVFFSIIMGELISAGVVDKLVRAVGCNPIRINVRQMEENGIFRNQHAPP